MLRSCRARGGAPLALLLLLGGCGIPTPLSDALANGVVAGASVVSRDPAQGTPVSTGGQSLRLSGTLGGEFAVERFPIGAGARGQEWVVTPNGFVSAPRVVALFDQDDNLLARQYMASSNGELRHVLRSDQANVTVAVMTPSGGQGGAFSFQVTRRADQPVPGAQAQVVYLNFAGGVDVKVHRRSAISFGPFDAAGIDPGYAGRTRELIELIVAEMRTDYAGYAVTFVSSTEGPPPSGAHSVLHFGGDSPGLLGLADSVDEYNRALREAAIVYSDGFSLYRTMQMSMEQMAVMIANVASHEVGHLLGLYHTADADDVMDTTAGAWELAGPQAFLRARLEPSVFAVGFEDSPTRLAHGVGMRAASGKALATARVRVGPEVTGALRRFMAAEMPVSCGTCLSLDRP